MWYIIKDDGTQFEVKARTYKQNILINYKLIELSDSNYASIDRGIVTDRYSTKLTFSGAKNYIENLIIVLDDLRINNKEVIMGGFPESVNIFGDHINYSLPIHLLIDDFGKLVSNKLNTFSWDVTFLATDISYTGTPSIPEDMQCLNSGYTTAQDFNTRINESYNRNNWFVDRVSDKYYFKGTYILSDADNNSLHNWWNTNRGNTIQIDESLFGVYNMFGPTFDGQAIYNIKIEKITYTIYAPKLRKVTVEFVRVD